MSEVETQQVYRDTFKIFDADNSGTVDIDELNVGLSKQGGKDFSGASVALALKVLLDKFDASSDGVLQIDEFVNLMSSTELEEFFAQEDANTKSKRGIARRRSVAMKQDIDLEEIYGLTPTPEEIPSLVQEKVAEFDRMLDDVRLEKKTAYAMAQEKCPGLCGEKFKLVFLRCEVFKVKRAVDRWIKYWDKRLDLFGKEKAFLPMTLDGAMEGCEKVAGSNYLSVAEGTTDPDGRAIMLFDFREEAKDHSSEDLLKTIWYQAHIALKSDLAQKKGIVLFVRCADNVSDATRVSHWKKIVESGKGAIPVRASALHFISPPAWMNALLRVVKFMLGAKLRKRVYVHSGSMDNVLASLSVFGLGTKDTLPALFGGDLVFSSNAK